MAITKWGPCSRSTALVDVAHAHGVAVHVDAVQAVGRVPVDVMAAGIDLLSLAGHKFGGPKGVGALYIREHLGATMQPVVYGGHQERERRAGTEDVPSIIALGTSLCPDIPAPGRRRHATHALT